MNTRSYSEMMRLQTFEDRFNYLRIGGSVGARTFGGNRHLNQRLYSSGEWRRFRDSIITRDLGRDLAVPGMELKWKITVHHINPITERDLIDGSDSVFDPDNAVCVAYNTHKAIHYGDWSLLKMDLLVERKPYDTCPWKEGSWQKK